MSKKMSTCDECNTFAPSGLTLMHEYTSNDVFNHMLLCDACIGSDHYKIVANECDCFRTIGEQINSLG